MVRYKNLIKIPHNYYDELNRESLLHNIKLKISYTEEELRELLKKLNLSERYLISSINGSYLLTKLKQKTE